MMDLGPISWLLSIQVICNHEACTITLSQWSYIDSILTHFNFTDAKLLSIPMDPNISFSKDQCPTSGKPRFGNPYKFPANFQKTRNFKKSWK